jgi:hypothetical protein
MEIKEEFHKLRTAGKRWSHTAQERRAGTHSSSTMAASPESCFEAIIERLLTRAWCLNSQPEISIEEPEEKGQPELRPRAGSRGKLPLHPGTPRFTPEPPGQGR